MKRATEIRPGPKRLAFLVLALAVLSGCEEPFGSAEKPEPNEGSTELLPEVTSGSQRDVEAPDVFEVTEAGLWDGRPSLGGIWVAHPDVTQPERVVIKNAANNKSVTGALFRRERNLPGPALQVSSAAAEQLGILAGAPTRLNVVALRREVVVEEPVPQEEDAAPLPDDEATEAAVETATATSEEPVAAEAEKPAKRKWWQRKEPAAAAAAGTAAGLAASTADEAAEVAAEAPAATTAAAPALSDAPVAAPAEPPAKRKWWQRKKPNEITETPLDPIEGAAAAIDATEAAPAAAAVTATATTSALAKPFVQIGTFGVEANANSAAEKIRRNGMSAEVRELTAEGNTVWRVLVGPAATRPERKALLNDVKDLGFTDAFTVSN